VFVTGDNRWWCGTEWPPARVRPSLWYAHPAGRLDIEPPTQSSVNAYRYDPRPVPVRARPRSRFAAILVTGHS